MSRVVSIVLLGVEQSGKTTFTMTAGQYAKGGTGKSPIGDDTGDGAPPTKEIRVEPFHTNLPKCRIAGKAADAGPIHPRELIYKFNDVGDYRDSINNRRDHELHWIEHESGTISFTFFDTPGVSALPESEVLEPNLGRVISIFKAVAPINSISLVLITIPKRTFTPDIQQAIQCCTDMFSELNTVIAFLHTEIDYERLHPSCPERFSQFRMDRRAELKKIINRSTFLEFYIDCDFSHSNKPIRTCITYNIIEKILQVANFNRPVSAKSIVVNKTPRMKLIDSLFINTYSDVLKEKHQTVLDMNDGIKVKLSELLHIQSSVVKTELEIQTQMLKLQRYQSDDLELLHEMRYDEDQDPNEGDLIAREFPTQEHVIEQVDIYKSEFNIEFQAGGKDCREWKARFRAMSTKPGIFHIRIYSKKSTIYRGEIEEAKKEIQRLQNCNEGLRKRMKRGQDTLASSWEKMQEELEWLSMRLRLIEWLRKDSIPIEIFQTLADSNAYTHGRYSSKREAVERVYFEKFNRDEAV
ncbi:hypothetical protein BGX27_001857 [Mortierella sp. AM989]|nr:hypothetical protein BGX27_001857 [Mortierella sp. AM989]